MTRLVTRSGSQRMRAPIGLVMTSPHMGRWTRIDLRVTNTVFDHHEAHGLQIKALRQDGVSAMAY